MKSLPQGNGFDLAKAQDPEILRVQPVPLYGPPEEPLLRDYWRILAKHRWPAIACLVITFTLSVIYTFRKTPLYEGTARLFINRESTDPLGFKEFQSSGLEDWDVNVALDTQVKILESDALALEVIRNLKLDQNPAFTGMEPQPGEEKGNSAPASIETDPKKESALLSRFGGARRISVVPRTRIVDISFTSPDPRLAAEGANAIAQTYIERNFRMKFESTMQTSDWLSKQLADLQMKVETSQEKLVRYQKESGILGLDEKQNIITSKLDELNKELTVAETDRIQKEARFQLSATGQPELLARLEPEALIDKLRAQEAQLRTDHAKAEGRFGSQYPAVLDLNRQLKQVEQEIQTESRRIASRFETEYQAALRREQLLRVALEKQKAEANLLNERAIQYNILKRDVETNRELYEGLLQKLKEAGVAAGLRSNNIRIVDLARVPTAPSKPNVPRNLALGLILGVLSGIGLAFLLESLDDTVRTPDQIEGLAALPSLALIPLDSRSDDGAKADGTQKRLLRRENRNSDGLAMVTCSRPKSQIAESYRALRTSILLSTMGSAPRVLIVTSPLPQEGKTTTSINTAAVLAQNGARVLLVDADMRRPGIASSLGMPSLPGLSNLLAGADAAEGLIVPHSQLNTLWVLPAGPHPPQPADLLGSPKMRECLAQWRQQYDHIIIDTPPALTVTDAVLLSAVADGVILVVRSGQTPKAALCRTRDLMLQVNARVIGVIVNAVNLDSLNYYSYGYGGKYYDEGEEKAAKRTGT